MTRRRDTKRLPGWLWFFLLLPMVLIVALLYKRQRLPAIMERARRELAARSGAKPRYVEPDSIPLVMDSVSIEAVDTAVAESPAGEMENPLPVKSVGEGEIVAVEMPAPPQEPPQGSRAVPPVDEPVPTQPAPETAPQSQPAAVSDDLKIIEGIGPAIDKLLQANGIATFQQLAAAPVEKLVEILTSARLGHLADPATWGEQASLAAEGRWEELQVLQRTLKGGRRILGGRRLPE